MKDFGFFSFGGLTISMHYQPEIIDKMQLNEILRKYSYLTISSNLLIPTTYVVDFSTKKYLAMSSNVQDLVGYPVSHFFDGGKDFFKEITDKADMAIIDEKISPFNKNFLNTIPKKERNQYTFTYNYRVNAKDGKKLMLYHQFTYIISPETGLPLYGLGLISDIGQLKKDTTILHQIVRLKNDGNTTVKEITHSVEYCPDQNILSKRELEILKLVAQGLNSKLIAEQLFISESTVVIHRKNMLDKTGCNNVAHLIAFAMRNQII